MNEFIYDGHVVCYDIYKTHKYIKMSFEISSWYEGQPIYSNKDMLSMCDSIMDFHRIDF